MRLKTTLPLSFPLSQIQTVGESILDLETGHVFTGRSPGRIVSKKRKLRRRGIP